MSRRVLLLIYGLIFILIFAIPSIINFSTDWLWFKEIGFENIFTTILGTRLSLFLIPMILSFILLYINYKTAFSSSEQYQHRPILIRFSEDMQQIDAGKYIDKIVFTVIFFISFLFGISFSGNWNILLEFINSTPFGELDPVFKRDISYYFFSLPIIQSVSIAMLTLTFIALFSAALIFLFRGAISLNQFSRKIEFAVPAKIHLSILAALLFIIIAIRLYFIRIPQLLYSSSAQFIGANYTDIYARLPALQLLTLISILCAILILAGIRKPTYKLALSAIILYFGINVVGGTIYPSFVQRFIVAPNEFAKESKYISNNIAATRKAWGIDKIEIRSIDGEKELTSADIDKNDLTIKNIRLWDRDPLLDTFGQIQEIRTYYDFESIDNDRYRINGEYRQVMLSARELNSQSLPNRTFINEQLVFTHGMGLTLGPVNQITKEGLPVLFIKDLPPKLGLKTKSLTIKQPEIYFGELSSSPVIARTKTKEFNYPSGDENVFTTYKGNGGVKLNSIAKRALFAAKFGKLPILLSDDITPESRIMYNRNITERVSKAFPFLAFDNDPYIVIDKGGLKWIYDAYTFSNKYPYSQVSPYSRDINYMRNSVKLVIDAYNGKIDAYIADNSDPIIKTYSKIFPKIFKSLDKMPKSLKEHIRYPEDIFAHQSQIYSIYHMNQPRIFYNKEDQWEIPLLEEGEKVDPLMRHIIMKLPGEQKEEFILMIPFTPRQKDNLAAWMVARSDGEDYGKLAVYRFPKQSLVFGPKQIINRMNQDAEISRQITLWDQRGSEVIRGNLLVIPIEESLIYVQSLYLRGEGGKIPELKRVIVAYKNKIAMEETLEKSLEKLFEDLTDIKEEPGKEKRPTEKQTTKEVKENLIRQAQKYYENALDAQQKGDWATYGAEIKKLGKILEKL